MKIIKIISAVLVALAMLTLLGHTIFADECTEHVFGEYVSDGNSTCETDGTKTAICTVCGTGNTVTDVGSKGHLTDSGTWSKNKLEHWKVCKICGKNVDASFSSHTYAVTHVTEATENSEGLDRYECVVCSYTYTDPVPKLIVEKDRTGAVVAIAITGLSISALLFFLAFRKPNVRRSKEKKLKTKSK